MTTMMSNISSLPYSSSLKSQNEPYGADYGFMTEWEPPEDGTEESKVEKQSFVVEDFMDKNAKAYSKRMNLHHSLQQCITCIIDTFKEFALNGVFYKKDYDSDDEWLVIDIDSEGIIDELLINYNHYTTMVNRSLPYENRKLIRFNFHPM